MVWVWDVMIVAWYLCLLELVYCSFCGLCVLVRMVLCLVTCLFVFGRCLFVYCCLDIGLCYCLGWWVLVVYICG